jgi:hypothetical protein
LYSFYTSHYQIFSRARYLLELTDKVEKNQSCFAAGTDKATGNKDQRALNGEKTRQDLCDRSIDLTPLSQNSLGESCGCSARAKHPETKPKDVPSSIAKAIPEPIAIRFNEGRGIFLRYSNQKAIATRESKKSHTYGLHHPAHNDRIRNANAT